MGLLNNYLKPDYVGILLYRIWFYEFGKGQASKIFNEVDNFFYALKSVLH